MYYVIETKYVGPNSNQHADSDTIEITTKPAITNMSHEERIDGWCGTTNDWAVYAHGEYDAEKAARNAIAEKFGECREDDNIETWDRAKRGVVTIFRPGKYAPMSSQATADWAYEGIQSDIESDTTDERIAELVAEYEEEANSNGCTLDSDLEGFMQERRQELRDELEYEA
ncbi:MAG: hypothetical protein H6966_09725 [Chromatiaceae bacterium]|nr:hypothetical protein [Chromatiaceae bacterium]